MTAFGYAALAAGWGLAAWWWAEAQIRQRKLNECVQALDMLRQASECLVAVVAEEDGGNEAEASAAQWQAGYEAGYPVGVVDGENREIDRRES